MLHYCHTETGNFGDDLNPWLWERLAPELCDPAAPGLFVGIGTLLSHDLPREPIKFVFGSGCGYKAPPRLDDRWKIYAVRGPLTAARLGVDPTRAVTDPALLVRRVAPPPPGKRHRVSFMPHHKSLDRADWRDLCARCGLHFIDPREPVEGVLGAVRESELLLAEAMHGAVIADAFRVPWIPVRMYSQFLEFKWLDWTRSVGVECKFADVPPIFDEEPPWQARLRNAWKRGWYQCGLGKSKWGRLPLRRTGDQERDRILAVLAGLPATRQPCLSQEATLARLEEQLLERLGQLRAEWIPAPNGRSLWRGHSCQWVST